MDEPLKKKLKIEEKNVAPELSVLEERDVHHNLQVLEETDVEHELEVLEEHLLKKCLCSLPENVLLKSLSEYYSNDTLSNLTSNWSRDQILMLVTSIHLVCETTIKQNDRNFICPRISEVCNSLKRNKNTLVDYFLELADDSDQFISFSASRALSCFFLVLNSDVNRSLVDRLTRNLVECSRSQKLLFSLEVLKLIIEYRSIDEHILDDYPTEEETPPVGCETSHVQNSGEVDCMHLKCLCVESLKLEWAPIVNRFKKLLLTNSHSHSSCIITFLNLWQTILHVKRNSILIDAKPFQSNLDEYVVLLTSQTKPPIPAIIWKHMLNLFNEVLCYAATLAIQGNLDGEPCTLAHRIVRYVKDPRQPLLSMVPYREGDGSFGGGSNDGDRVLLKKVVLFILKAVAVTVRETWCDSSDDSDMEESEDDMILIERTITEVLKKLDNFVKTILPFHPEASLSQWVVQLFIDQDDYLFESMLCCLDVYIGLCDRKKSRSRDSSARYLPIVLNPTISFLQFLHSVSFSSSVLLDFLITDTKFLSYILRYLKYLCRNWEEFVNSCNVRQLEDVMTLLIRLRLSLERKIRKNLFPYDINPVLKLITKCEYLYEQTQYIY